MQVKEQEPSPKKRTAVVLVTSFFVKARTRREGRGPKNGLFVRMYFIESLPPKNQLTFQYLLKEDIC